MEFRCWESPEWIYNGTGGKVYVFVCRYCYIRVHGGSWERERRFCGLLREGFKRAGFVC